MNGMTLVWSVSGRIGIAVLAGLAVAIAGGRFDIALYFGVFFAGALLGSFLTMVCAS